ncbi:MAG: NUDIX domain-containing protein [Candidatus Paceibacterota bacterium]
MEGINKDILNKDIEFHGVMGLVFIGEDIIVYRRDNKTKRFPLAVDILGGGREGNESPFETFKREVFEEVALNILEDYVVYAKRYQSIVDAKKSMFFIVVKSDKLRKEDIVFGNEGLEYIIMSPKDFILLPDGVSVQQKRTEEYLNFK